MAGVSKTKQIRRQQLEARRTAHGQAGPKVILELETHNDHNDHNDGASDGANDGGQSTPGNQSVPMIDAAEPEHILDIDTEVRITHDQSTVVNVDSPPAHIDLVGVDPLPPHACGHLLPDPRCDECHPAVLLPRLPKLVTSETQTDIGGVGQQHNFLWDTFVYMMQARAAHAPAPCSSLATPVMVTTSASTAVGWNDENAKPLPPLPSLSVGPLRTAPPALLPASLPATPLALPPIGPLPASLPTSSPAPPPPNLAANILKSNTARTVLGPIPAESLTPIPPKYLGLNYGNQPVKKRGRSPAAQPPSHAKTPSTTRVARTSSSARPPSRKRPRTGASPSNPPSSKPSAAHTLKCGACHGSGQLHNTSPITEVERQEISKVLEAVNPLIAADGKDALNHPQFRRALAVHFYCLYRLDNFGKLTARKLASTRVFLHERRHGVVKAEYNSLLRTNSLRKRMSGGNRSKQADVLSSSMDKMRDWLRTQPRGTVKPLAFARWVSSTILVPKFGAEPVTGPASRTRGPSSMSIRTAKRWLRALGWVYGKDTKGAYTDGKCRDDVIAARNSFILAMDGYAARTRKVEESYMTRAEFVALDKSALATIVTDAEGQEVMCGKSCERCAGGEHLLVSRMVNPDLDDKTRLLVPVYHDECTFMANDGKSVFWMPRWSHSLKKKSRGKGIMISSFVCECHGELRVAIPVSDIAQLNPPTTMTTAPASTTTTTAAASTTTTTTTAAASTTTTTTTAAASTTTTTTTAAASTTTTTTTVAASTTTTTTTAAASATTPAATTPVPPPHRIVIELPDDDDINIDESDDEDDEDDARVPEGVAPDPQPDGAASPDAPSLDDGGVAGESEMSARVAFEYGKNSDGYWTGQHLYEQVVDRLLPVFEAMHSSGLNGLPCQGLFIFDNAAGHKIYASDALVARNLNLSDGGAKVPKLRATSFKKPDGTIVEQAMQDADGKQKGIKTILVERGKWTAKGPDGKSFRLKCDKCKGAMADDPERSSRKDCCATRVLECEPDFASQRSLLAEVIEDRGHLTLFLPKFHPELNPIERLWSAAKSYAREHCEYSFTTLRTIVPRALASVRLSTIRRYFRKCDRFLSIYRLLAQCSPALVEYLANEPTFKLHRRVGENDLQQLVQRLKNKGKLGEREQIMLDETLKDPLLRSQA